jgi:hypothetical protein
MEELVHMAEDVLRQLEKDVIFRRFCGVPGQPARRPLLATSVERAAPKVDAPPQKLGIHVREDHDIREFGRLIVPASEKSEMPHPAKTPDTGGWLQTKRKSIREFRHSIRGNSTLDRALITFRTIAFIGIDGRSPYRVGYWFPAIEIAISFLFFLSAIAAFVLRA